MNDSFFDLLTKVTEDMLKKEFGHYGSVHSVKIMWPRTDEERYRHSRTPSMVADLTLLPLQETQ